MRPQSKGMVHTAHDDIAAGPLPVDQTAWSPAPITPDLWYTFFDCDSPMPSAYDDSELLSEFLSRYWPFGIVLLALVYVVMGNYWKANHRPKWLGRPRR